MKYEKYEDGRQIADLSKSDIAEIGAKAFLSCKTVEKILLPEKVEKIGDWAFSHAKNLREIVVPLKNIILGKQVFLGCEGLEKVSFLEKDGTMIYEGISYFMASLLRDFENGQLLELEGLELQQEKWLMSYDETLSDYINRPPDADFKPVFIGWFDVEDIDSQWERHIVATERKRLELILQRLQYDAGLSEQRRKEFYEYVCLKETQLYALFCDKTKKYGSDIQYYKLWKLTGGLTGSVAAKLLEATVSDDAEIRAYLVKVQLDASKHTNFFDELIL